MPKVRFRLAACFACSTYSCVIDGQVEIMHHLYVAEGLVDVLEANTGHSSSLLFSFSSVQTSNMLAIPLPLAQVNPSIYHCVHPRKVRYSYNAPPSSSPATIAPCPPAPQSPTPLVN